MEMDLDKVVGELLPWEFGLRSAGVVYPTRPLLVADVALLQALVGSADKSIEKLRAQVAGLFGEQKPDVGSWRMEKLLAAVGAILRYWKANAEKNSGPVSTAVAGEMGRLLSTPGSSPSP